MHEGDKSKIDQSTWQVTIWSQPYFGMPLIVWSSAILLVAVSFFAVFIPNPTETQSSVIRFMIAICGTVISTVFFGAVSVRGSLQKLKISATGPMAIFFLLQFVSNPIQLVKPNAPAGHKAIEMTPRPCKEEEQLHSIQSETQSAVLFRNNSTATVKIYWLDFDGKRQPYGTLAPKEAPFIQSTFLTHPWLVANMDDECLAIYLPESEVPAVVMR